MLRRTGATTREKKGGGGEALCYYVVMYSTPAKSSTIIDTPTAVAVGATEHGGRKNHDDMPGVRKGTWCKNHQKSPPLACVASQTSKPREIEHNFHDPPPLPPTTVVWCAKLVKSCFRRHIGRTTYRYFQSPSNKSSNGQGTYD